MLNCQESAQDLSETLKDLYVQKFDNLVTEWTNKLSIFEHTADRIQSDINQRTDSASEYVNSDRGQQAYSDNIRDYSDLIDNQNAQIEQRKKELAQLRSQLNESVSQGNISEGSEAYYDMLSDIHDVENEIDSLTESVIDNTNNLAEQYKNIFDGVTQQYENELELLEHLTNTYNTQIDKLEASGYLASTEYYAALKDVEEQNISAMKQELAELTNALTNAVKSGEIEEYSDAWYDMQSSINGVKEAIEEANVQLVEYTKTMREIEWERFDYLQDRISQITQESDFLIDLMSNSNLYQDNGQFNDEGMATMGLHAQNYNVYMAQADKYADEILAINEEIAKDPYNTELIERREELLKLQQESILAAEDEKNAIVDMVEEGINIELEALKELIDAYQDSLDSAKDLYDYQKNIQEQSANISSLQKQLTAYENDTSEETRAKIQQIRVELVEAQSELEETEYEQFISETKALLDNLYIEYESILNERLDNVDALLADMINMINANSAVINETLNGNTGSISETINRVANDVGYVLTQNMRDIWNSDGAIKDVVALYGDNFSDKLTTINSVLGAIQINVAAMAQASENTAKETIKNTSTTTKPTTSSSSYSANKTTTTNKNTSTTTKKEITVGSKINAGNAYIYDYVGDTSGERQYFASDPIYTVIKEQNGYILARWHKLSSGYTGWFKKSDVKAYKAGGLVDYTGLAQLDGTPDKPELVLNAKDTDNFIGLRDALRAMSQEDLGYGNVSYKAAAAQLYGLADISDVLANIRGGYANSATTVGDINITIPIEHVQDYNDFITQLQKDRQFEKMIQSMTTDRLAGNSALTKNKYRWS